NVTGGAIGLFGRPFSSQSVSTLSELFSHVSARTESFQFKGLLTTGAILSRVNAGWAGDVSVLGASARVEHLTINELTCELIEATLECRVDEQPGQVRFSVGPGNRLEGLTIGGYPVRVVLKPEFSTTHPFTQMEATLTESLVSSIECGYPGISITGNTLAVPSRAKLTFFELKASQTGATFLALRIGTPSGDICCCELQATPALQSAAAME
ncbi:MAG: hypothetical protein JO270_12095, partial [Acidobacteriaceae bacterium]|nr:hypothetical protein [Acidobacteriaceae bacterium]